MLIGLILLSVLAVLIFFGVAERFFRRIGVPDWLAFVLVLSFVIGAVVPEIQIGAGMTLNVGGFIIPAAFVILLFSISPVKKESFHVCLATIFVAGVTVAIRMLVRPDSGILFLVTAVVTGLLCGTVAYLMGRTRIATLVGAVTGIVIGDIINNISLWFLHGTSVSLGANGVFDSVVIATITGVALVEVIEAIRHAMSRKHISLTAFRTEAAEDVRFFPRKKSDSTDDEYRNYFEDTD